ncbi:ABC transporter permease [Cellulomonas timonensis]|uniref:ABC transporter permease n=1 Tax=Cellulomonas timonensis TaxID=1689271 RepID=UPI00083178DA|nr:ABC transporter permease [Cellulomonas timonensis]
MSGIVSTLVEAWDELRIHKLRVLLALIGVAVAVTAITGITAAVQMMNQAFREQAERYNGRDVTLMATAYQRWSGDMVATTSTTPDPAVFEAAYTRVVEQYGIEHWSRVGWGQAPFRFPTGTQMVQLQVVDPAFGVINRFQTTDGRWFADSDVERLAPAVVVNETFWKALGEPALDTHPTIVLGGPTPVRAEVIGVYASSWDQEPPAAYALTDHVNRWTASNEGYGPPELRMWVPPEMAEELQPLITRDLMALLPGYDVNVYPNEYYNALDSATKWVVLGVGGFALLLGGLRLVNIALVTVRHRIREIGIRRSFGATSGRVFFGVLMESVVATVVAGLVGVVIAVAIIKNIPVERVFGGGIEDMPPFPLSAAMIGMACATGVGALAGLIPATVAVRVKVIDAIRY